MDELIKYKWIRLEPFLEKYLANDFDEKMSTYIFKVFPAEKIRYY